MYRGLLIVALLLVAVAMALALAHALELPGKMRLSKDAYLAVQKIYYPGFTFGGAAEPLAIIALVALLFIGPHGGPRFWWAVAACVALVVSHGIYLLVRHPSDQQFLAQGLPAHGARRDVLLRFHARGWRRLDTAARHLGIFACGTGDRLDRRFSVLGAGRHGVTILEHFRVSRIGTGLTVNRMRRSTWPMSTVS